MSRQNYGPLFHGMAESAIKELLDQAEQLDVPEGQFLILDRQSAKRLYLLTGGQVRIEMSLAAPGPGGQQHIATLGAGEVIGELALLGFSRRNASARAIADVKACAWERDWLLEKCRNEPTFGYQLMHNIATILGQRLVATSREYGAVLYQALYGGDA